MASLFKIMKLDYALDAQDEQDKQKLSLMGLTNTEHYQDLNKALEDLQNENDQKFDIIRAKVA